MKKIKWLNTIVFRMAAFFLLGLYITYQFPDLFFMDPGNAGIDPRYLFHDTLFIKTHLFEKILFSNIFPDPTPS